jgi:hypothetical protein
LHGNIVTFATYSLISERKGIRLPKNFDEKIGMLSVVKVAACIASDSFSFAIGNTIVIDGVTILS